MPVCEDCFYFKKTDGDRGECQINGATEAGRDSGRCPSRTFRPKAA